MLRYLGKFSAILCRSTPPLFRSSTCYINMTGGRFKMRCATMTYQEIYRPSESIVICISAVRIQSLFLFRATKHSRKSLFPRTYCSLNAIMAQPQNCTFGVNTTIEFKKCIDSIRQKPAHLLVATYPARFH
jgi:hypothetical protein